MLWPLRMIIGSMVLDYHDLFHNLGQRLKRNIRARDCNAFFAFSSLLLRLHITVHIEIHSVLAC